MIFNKILGLEKVPENMNIIVREAVRAVALNSNNQLVMIQSRIGDYSFPGGGIDERESHLDALKREALEEAGIIIKEDIQLLGVVEEKRKSLEIDGAYFAMKSTYYLCCVSGYTEPKLEEYEKEWGFTPVEINASEAYEKNLNILQHHEQCPPWLERDTLALKCLLDEGSV